MAAAIVALIVIAAAMARREDIEAGRQFWKGSPWPVADQQILGISMA